MSNPGPAILVVGLRKTLRRSSSRSAARKDRAHRAPHRSRGASWIIDLDAELDGEVASGAHVLVLSFL